ncbi:unnamed protein product [Durusdinium trenchii]|uniref:EamA domain-containing protein n=2 Tax=Durusdinium trenchii TaxID=1381693 RepID=A0ABP0ICD4_9DINO
MAVLLPLFLAAGGGFLWAFGVLGKRIGVEGATVETQTVRAAITIFVYTLTTACTPLLDLWHLGAKGWFETWNDPVWSSRVPLVIVCGVISGLGGLLGTIAFAWSAGSDSALVSMIENGMYTMMSAIIIAIYFQEHPKIQAYFGFVLILLGVLLAQKSSSSKGKGENESDSEEHPPQFELELWEPKKLGKTEEEAEDLESSEASSSTDARHERCGASRFSAPSCFGRCGAVALAMCAGSCWGFGPLGKKIGVHGSEDHQRQAWAACTYFVYMLSTIFVPLLRVLTAHGRREALEDSSFRCRLLGTVLCGLVSGFGGMLSTFAFAQEGYYSGALISTVENGIYTVFGAVLITVVFREKLSQRQLISALSVTLAIVIFGLDFKKIFGGSSD